MSKESKFKIEVRSNQTIHVPCTRFQHLRGLLLDIYTMADGEPLIQESLGRCLSEIKGGC